MAANNELLIKACQNDDLDLLEVVLASDTSSFNINHTDNDGNSALHYAARYASTGCLEVLMYYDGIKVNAANKIEGDTPLHKAAAYQDPEFALEMVQILVGAGASAKIQNKLSQTPFDVVSGATHEEVKKFLETAALNDNYDPSENDDGVDDEE